MTNNIRIDYDRIVQSIRDEFATLYNEISINDEELYNTIKGITVYVDDEQNYLKRKEVQSNSIYIVVKFGSASINYGASACPLSLIIFSTENKIKPVQKLLNAFCARWTLQPLQNWPTAQQSWNTASVAQNFMEMGNAYRSLLTMPGVVVIGKDVLDIDKIYYVFDEDEGRDGMEEIDIISYSDQFNNSLDTQPFGNTHGRATSVSKFSVFAFIISTYLTDSRFVRDCLLASGYFDPSEKDDLEKGQNHTFKFIIIYSNGYTIRNSEFKMTSMAVSKHIGAVNTLAVGFTN